jgi:phenylacetate-CoA ligase
MHRAEDGMSSLPDYVVLDPGVERLPQERLRALQSERLRAMVNYTYERAPFWQTRFDAIGLAPCDVNGVDDLTRLPFCTREDIEADQAAHPPFGSYLAAQASSLTKFMTTSGTTGRLLNRVCSARDWRYILERLQRNPRVSRGDVVFVLGPIDGLMGPMAGAESAARAGALVVLAGLYDTRTKVRLIQQLRPQVVTGTATYLLHVGAVAREMGIELRDVGISTVTSVGEPGAAILATRQRLANIWGATVTDGYGLTEMFPLGGACPHSTAIHIASDFVITEIVDPRTGQPMPHGEPGEIVYTNIIGDTQPLLRYRTRDVGRLDTNDVCTCGFTGVRLRHSVEGRIDDMIWYRGVNVFPSAIEAVVRGIPELGDEYEIVVDRERPLPTITLRVEVTQGAESSSYSELERRLQAALKSAIRVGLDVEFLGPGVLPRSDGNGKRRRIVDRRPPSGYSSVAPASRG